MALNLFKHLMPAEEAFTPLFCEQAKCIAEAAAELSQMMSDGTAAGQQHVASIRKVEMAADAIARKIFIAANRTFNAPIDREDILALAHVLDDCVDLIEDTAKGIQRYGVADFPAEMRAIADAGLTRLRAQLQAGEIDTIGYIDRKEIYELVEDVVDKCDDVANAVQTITAKHV
jgi:uncharacterized protein Yka (UPF0111/DUF47 family)